MRKNTTQLNAARIGMIGKVGLISLTGLLVGCNAGNSQHTSAPVQFSPAAPALPVGDGVQRAGGPMDAIDLTAENTAVATTIEPTVIDTAAFPVQRQLPAFHDGPTDFIKNMLPEHGRDKSIPAGPMALESFEIGEITSLERAKPGLQFPTIGSTPWQPPDPSLAVGPNHIVVTVNMAVAFYTKDGVEQFSAPLNDTGNPGFFEDIGAGGFTFDPKCFYDHHAQRFFILALEVYSPSESWITIAISDDADPNGVWHKYRTPSVISVGGSTYWVDYPGLGFDADGVYTTGNLFLLDGSGGGFAGALFRFFDKAPLLTGSPATFFDIRRGDAASVQVAQHFGDNPAAYFVSVENSSQMRVWSVRTPTTSPNIAFVNVNIPSFNGSNVEAPNAGGQTVTTLPGRIMNAAWRNSSLLLAHTTNTGGRAVARWYEFDTGNWPASGPAPSLAQSGSVDAGPGGHTFFPAIYSNAVGDAAMVVARSSASQFVSMEATARKAADASGTMGALQRITIGNATASGRWGDYFDIAIDPNDDTTFWLIGERETTSGWQTWVSSLATVSCPGDIADDFGAPTPDGMVSFGDFLALLGLVGPCAGGSPGCTGDIADDFGSPAPDGMVSFGDFLALLGLVGPCP